MKFEKWLDMFIDEKGIDKEQIFEIDNNIFEYGYVIEQIKASSESDKNKIKNMLVKIDFVNGDVKHFLRYLAKALI